MFKANKLLIGVRLTTQYLIKNVLYIHYHNKLIPLFVTIGSH